MSVVGHAPPPFFKRGPAPLVRLVFFVSLSVVLLVADLRFQTLEWARLAVATAAWPLQRATGVPVEAAGDFGAYLSRQSTLLKENEELRRRQLGTANLLLRQEHLEQENKRLRALLDQYPNTTMVGGGMKSSPFSAVGTSTSVRASKGRPSKAASSRSCMPRAIRSRAG